MYDALGSDCAWQPNMFPGLVFRADNSTVVLLCFNSGKILITVGKLEHDIFMGWKNVWPTVAKFISEKQVIKSIDLASQVRLQTEALVDSSK